MDVLKRLARGSTLVLFAGLFAATTAACGLVRWLGFEEGARRPFSHKVHGKAQELECSACHPKAEKEAGAGMPVSLKKCMLCHEEMDDKHPDRKLATLVGEKPEWSRVTDLPDEVIFSHQVHLAKSVKCAECHVGIENNESVDASLRVDMDACIACHGSKATRPDDCSTCHREIRRDVPPATHRVAWDRRHGDEVREGKSDPASRCGLCHQEAQCSKCHQDEAPRNHTAFWRLQGHGISAETDRQRCETCHRTDFCDRCHRETAPRNHTATWAGTANRHCQSCHVPAAGDTNCAMCHRSATHDSAPPRPSNAQHAGATPDQCRTCHETIGIPHPDNGDGCAICH